VTPLEFDFISPLEGKKGGLADMKYEHGPRLPLKFSRRKGEKFKGEEKPRACGYKLRSGHSRRKISPTKSHRGGITAQCQWRERPPGEQYV